MVTIAFSRNSSPEEYGASSPSIGAVLKAIAADATFSDKRRADICSAVRTLCGRLHIQLESTPADPRLFAERLANVTEVTVAMSRGRFQNCRSLLDATLAYANKRMVRRRSRTPLAPEYAALLAYATSRWQVIRLRALFRYASERAILPEGIDETVMTAFAETIRRSTVKKPHNVERMSRHAWNQLIQAVPGLGSQTVTINYIAERYVLEASAFPQSLWDDLEAYLSSRATPETTFAIDSLLTEEELFAEDARRTPPIRTSTANLIRYRVRQFASVLVIEGVVNVEQMTSLASLVSPATINRGLQFFVRRAEGKLRNSQMYGIATDLLMIAQHWVRLPASDLQKLKILTSKVRPQHEGLPHSARRSLAPLRDLPNVRAFLAVSELILRDAEKEKSIDRATANRVATALWIRIAQRAPLRISNLLTTRLDTNIIRSVGKSGSVALLYPPDQVKNRKTLEVPLPRSTVAMLDLYLRKYRPVLVEGESPWLFPAPNGKYKKPGVMSADIQRLMRSYIGFAINPHSFRHVAAKLYLSVNPGDYESVQLILGHRARETTVRYYCDLEAEEAFRHFDAVLLGLEAHPDRRRPS
ncbi:site-specific integrase [Alsobacter sp. SYSU M60028]|uniref:Site-specific integrase n=1 Tax=Alsobacter ponti TaxID=2962936 RepID=A0ABT1LFN6_9HYPH|nr:site-specific integrase [Alsobacter ponti]MCP8939928.1 site-specific integrase [Alsobacter ponti]